MLLEVAPEFFDVIELGRRFRQPFDREPMRPRRECGAGRLAGVDRAVVEVSSSGDAHLSPKRFE